MSKISRLTGKIFGETATATGDDPEIGQFGSALAGTYNGTTDVATIQGLAAWSNGFIDAVTSQNQYPPLPEMTGFGKVLSHQICYTLQQGVPEWDSATEYYSNAFCAYKGAIYKSIADAHTNQQPDISPNYWVNYLTNYTPFSINSGSALNGANNTLTYSGSTITCDPCTITTCDGKTLTDATARTLDVSTPITTTYFNQPVLSANGTLGGSSMAISVSDAYNATYAGYKAFDKDNTTFWLTSAPASVTFPINLIIYNPVALNISKFTVTNRGTYASTFTAGKVYGSNNNSDYTELASFSNSNTAALAQWDINITGNDNYYLYYKIEFTSAQNDSGSATASYGIAQVDITATETYGGDYIITKSYEDGSLGLLPFGSFVK